MSTIEREETTMELLAAGFAAGKHLCLGLDPVWGKIPRNFLVDDTSMYETMYWFCRSIVDTTSDVVLAYKPNRAFFARYGYLGTEVLEKLIRYIHQQAPNVPVILDGKSNDIGNSMAGYVDEAFAFSGYGADALTANPYLGQDACQPLLDETNSLGFYLCHTSNKGADEFQDGLQLLSDTAEIDALKRLGHVQHWGHTLWLAPLYQHVAYRIAKHWNVHGNCALVVGATYPEQLRQVRRIVGADMPILVPGIGTQGGDLAQTIAAGGGGPDSRLIINASSSLMYAEYPRGAAQYLDEQIRHHMNVNA